MVEQVLRYRNDNMSCKNISKELGISVSQVSKILIENGHVDHIKTDRATIDKIASMYRDNYSFKDISKALKVHPDTIRNALYITKCEIRPTAYHSNYKDRMDHDYFENIDTEEKAYWLGFLYADGYVNEKTYQIEVSLKREDESHLIKLQNSVKCEEKVLQKIVNGYPISRVILYSKKMTQDLKNNGCFQAKSLELEPPTEDIVPKNLIRHFIRGYVDGDGCFSTGLTFSIVGTLPMLEYIIEHLQNNTTISKRGSFTMTGKAHQWTHNSYRDFVKIHDYLYKDANIYLERKYAKRRLGIDLRKS